jgi:hypothetical protein
MSRSPDGDYPGSLPCQKSLCNDRIRPFRNFRPGNYQPTSANGGGKSPFDIAIPKKNEFLFDIEAVIGDNLTIFPIC